MVRAVRALALIATLALLCVPVRAQEAEPEPSGPSPSAPSPAAPSPAAPSQQQVPWYQRGASAAPEAAPEQGTASRDEAAQDDAAPEEAARDEAPAQEQAPAAEPQARPETQLGGFHFGSYGRIVAAADPANGRLGRQSNITVWGPRVDEADTYAEIELRREDRLFGIDTRIVATVAYGGPLFHFDGELSERIAIRNLYAATQNLLTPGLGVWAGSRMWRGDDVYLMNFWPLDNLNMVGGGASYALEQIGELSIAAGLSQPNDPFMRQETLVPARDGFLPDSVLFLDRPRLVVAAKLTWWPFGRLERRGMKAILYGEQHYLPSGQIRRDNGFVENLPDDAGWVLGAQVGGYLPDGNTFANLFVRYARGLGAYDPLGVPFREGSVIQTGRAEELRFALSANWEHDFFGLQVGAYWRLFRDADPNVFERGLVTEGAIDLRPYFWIGDVVGIAGDLSYQGMQATSIDEASGQPVQGNVFKLGILPFISPGGRGTYTRPHLRLIYTLTVRDDAARRLYPSLDLRSSQNVEHFLGIGVEWWFSSSSYGS